MLDAAAITSELRSGISQSGSRNSAPYQRSDRSCGGKRRLCWPLSDTPVDHDDRTGEQGEDDDDVAV